MRLPLPWQQDQWAQLARRSRDGSLPHALLFHGPSGLGKRALALHLAQYLLCLEPGLEAPCGHCAGCKLYQAGSHPDIFELMPEAEKKGISIDQVRELIEWQGIMAHRGGYKVVIVDNANRLNRHGANALLKTLEEPASRTVIVLISENPGGLLATIRSRVQRLAFVPPPRSTGIEYLKIHGISEDISELLLRLARGAPLTALALAEQQLPQQRSDFFRDLAALSRRKALAVTVARDWEKQDRHTLYRWLDSWCRDLIRLKIHGQTSLLDNSDLATELKQLAAAGPGAPAMFRLLDRITQSLRDADHPLNAQLQLEDLLLYWQGLYTRSG